MTLVTFGIYPLYLFYKNWISIKTQTNNSIMPLFRTLFFPLWIYSSYKYLKIKADEYNIQGWFPLLLLTLLSLIPFINLLPMILANSLALKVNKKIDSKFKNNSSISSLNFMGILFPIGLVLTFVVIILIVIKDGTI